MRFGFKPVGDGLNGEMMQWLMVSVYIFLAWFLILATLLLVAFAADKIRRPAVFRRNVEDALNDIRSAIYEEDVTDLRKLRKTIGYTLLSLYKRDMTRRESRIYYDVINPELAPQHFGYDPKWEAYRSVLSELLDAPVSGEASKVEA